MGFLGLGAGLRGVKFSCANIEQRTALVVTLIGSKLRDITSLLSQQYQQQTTVLSVPPRYLKQTVTKPLTCGKGEVNNRNVHGEESGGEAFAARFTPLVRRNAVLD